MAQVLSGTFGTNYGSYLRIQGDWSATQDKSANTSTITLRTYWIDRGSSTGISSSSSKSGSSTIEGTSNGFTATAGLYSNQKKLINTQVRTISHSSNGTFSDLDLAVAFSPEITFSGTYYGNVSSSASFELKTIPRESSIASDCSWSAPGNETISISRGSTSFNHVTKVYVRNTSNAYVFIKDVVSPASEMYTLTDFSTAEKTQIVDLINGRQSADTQFILYTYSGGSLIGTSTHYGTVTIDSSSTLQSGYDAYWYTDETIDLALEMNNTNYTHTVRFKFGSYTKTLTSVGSSVTWNPSTAEEASIHAQFTTSTSLAGSVEIDTFYNGKQVGGTSSRFMVFVVRDASPVFTGTVTYSDTNTSITAITGNNQYIVQGKSNLKVTLSSSSASAQKGASLVEYVFHVAGETIAIPYTSSAITVDFATISASTNQTVSVEAVDSRGNRTAISKIVNVVPYALPSLNATAARVNGFEPVTKLNASGTFSTITVAGTAKNYITSLRYRTRKSGGSWSGYVTLTRNNSGNTFTAVEKVLSFPSAETHEVEIDVLDRFATKTVKKIVAVGTPIFFMDDMLSSIAFGGFPTLPNVFDMQGRNIVEANAIKFRPDGNLVFPRTFFGEDAFKVKNQKVYLNDVPFFELDSVGVVRFEKHKMGNGYNMASIRSTTSHEDSMLIQSTTAVVTVSGNNGYVDITFPTSFIGNPEWVVATAKNSSSSTANVAVYNHSSSGCRIWLQRIGSTAVTYDVEVEVVACGRK